MVDVNKLDEELGDADSEQLQYIYDTQKDLYSAEELAYILKLKAMRVQEEDAEERALLAKAEEYLPKEINCPKCDGPNDFHNDVCRFCGAKLKKAEYYNRAAIWPWVLRTTRILLESWMTRSVVLSSRNISSASLFLSLAGSWEASFSHETTPRSMMRASSASCLVSPPASLSSFFTSTS